MKDLSLLTWKEIKALDKEKSIVFVVLAPIEEHGLCLPLATDLLEGLHWSKGAMARVEAVLDAECYYLPAGAAGTGTVAGDGITGVCEECCLHLNFRGGFSRTGEAHRIIRHYADEQGIAIADRAVEVYNRDMSVDVYWPLQACPES